MVSQMVGLAQAVGMSYVCKSTRLGLPWRWLPLSLVPRSASSLADPILLQDAATAKLPPRLVISCGRHGVIPSLALKKQFGDRIFSVHIQDPKINPAPFDLVVVPSHDRLRGPNVLVTTGAIHPINAERLAEARTDPQFADFARTTDRPVVAVLVGGPNGCYSFGEADIKHFVANLQRVTQETRARLVVLTSNRTPPELSSRLRKAFASPHYVWDGESPNPYLAALAAASHVIVTGDSVSMVTEAAATGRPVFVQHLTVRRRATRFQNFHELFQQAGITRPFDGTLADWTYKTPNDTPRVAAIIQERIAFRDTSARAA